MFRLLMQSKHDERLPHDLTFNVITPLNVHPPIFLATTQAVLNGLLLNDLISPVVPTSS